MVILIRRDDSIKLVMLRGQWNGSKRNIFIVTCMNLNLMNLKQDGDQVQAAAAAKKQCGGVGARMKSKQAKLQAAPAPTKDPQSVAAKVRREKIAEKLKVLQDLVPNGTKVHTTVACMHLAMIIYCD
jgi:hypothetical protein